MKKILNAMILLIIIIAASCKPVNDVTPASSTGATTTTNLGAVAIAAGSYQYFNKLYSPATGSAYNTTALTGALFEKYLADVQKVINERLIYPPQVLSSRTAGALAWYNSATASASGVAAGASTGDIAQQFINFIQSAAGTEFLNTVLAQVDSTITHYINYAVDYAYDKIEDTLNTATQCLQAMAGSMAFMALTGTGGGFLSAGLSIGNLFATLFYGAKIVSMLKQIQETLNRIESKLEIMNRKLDSIQYNVIAARMESVRAGINTAKAQLNAVITNLEAASTDAATYSEAVKNLFITDASYGTILLNALNSAFSTQTAFRDNVATVAYKVTKIDGVTIKKGGTLISYYGVWIENPMGGPSGLAPAPQVAGYYTGGDASETLFNNISIPEPRYFVKCSPEDVQFLLRMSLLRIDMLSKAYSGNQLLKMRASFANSDLTNLVNVIKAAVNTTPTIIGDYLSNDTAYKTSIDNLITNFINKNLVFQYGYYTISNYVEWTYHSEASWISNPGIAIEAPTIYLTDSYQGISNQALQGETIIRQQLENAFKNYIYNVHCKTYLVNLLSTLAEWEIKLRAHIDAGAGL